MSIVNTRASVITIKKTKDSNNGGGGTGSAPKKYKCRHENCNSEYTRNDKLKNHIHTKHQGCTCTSCTKQYSRIALISSHRIVPSCHCSNLKNQNKQIDIHNPHNLLLNFSAAPAQNLLPPPMPPHLMGISGLLFQQQNNFTTFDFQNQIFQPNGANPPPPPPQNNNMIFQNQMPTSPMDKTKSICKNCCNCCKASHNGSDACCSNKTKFYLKMRDRDSCCCRCCENCYIREEDIPKLYFGDQSKFKKGDDGRKSCPHFNCSERPTLAGYSDHYNNIKIHHINGDGVEVIVPGCLGCQKAKENIERVCDRARLAEIKLLNNSNNNIINNNNLNSHNHQNISTITNPFQQQQQQQHHHQQQHMNNQTMVSSTHSSHNTSPSIGINGGSVVSLMHEELVDSRSSQSHSTFMI